MRHSNSHLPALEGRTLLDELNHRIKNELASVINLVSFKAIWTDNIDAKEELSKSSTCFTSMSRSTTF